MADDGSTWPDDPGRAVAGRLAGPARGAAFPERYELVEAIGRGGMAVVYRAVDRVLKRTVAVKLLNARGRGTEVHRGRFEREARTLARLSHPNVVRVFETGETGGDLYIAMEFVDGGSLDARLRSGAQERRELVALLEKAARGVQSAHEQGIVHRDLKPANILVTAGGQPKVADFGLATLAEGPSQLTASDSILGTAQYMAPEQVEGRPRDVDPRTDVHALGAILYEVLAGRSAFQGRSVADVFDRIRHLVPDPPGRIAPDVPAGLEAVAMRALEKDPRRRHPTAGAFADELERAMRGGWTGGVARRLAWARRPRGRRGKLVAALGAAAIVVLVVWRASSAPPGPAVDPRQEAEEADLDRRALALFEEGRAALDLAERGAYDPNISLEEIQALAARGNERVEAGLALAPRLAIGHHLHGRALALEGRSAEALVAWRRAIEIDPRFAEARFEVGRSLLARAYETNLLTGDRSGAGGAGQALALEAAIQIERALAASGEVGGELERDLAEAMLAYLRREYDALSGLLERAIGRFGDAPGAEEFHWLQGLVGSPERRCASLDRALAIRPRFPRALLARADERSFADDFDRALPDYDEAIRIEPRLLIAYINRSACRRLSGDLAGASGDAEEAIRLDAACSRAWFQRGMVFYCQGELEPAARDLGEAIRLDPRDGCPLATRAAVRRQRGDLAGALEDSTRAVELDSGLSTAWDERGAIHRDLGLRLAAEGRLPEAHAEFQSALRDHDQSVALEPRHPGFATNRGAARSLLGDQDGAIADYSLALELAPPDWPHRPLVEGVLKELLAKRGRR